MFGTLLAALVILQTPSPEVVTEFLVQGSSIGQNTLTIAADGSFVSKSKVKAGPLDMQSDVTGKLVKGIVTEFTMVEVTKTVNGKIIFKDGKVSVEQNGKLVMDKKESPYKSGAFLTNWHPVMWTGIYTEYKKNPGKPIQLAIVNGLTSMEAKLTEATKSVEVGEGRVQITVLTTTLGGQTIDLVFDDQGTALGMGVAAQQAAFIRKGYEKAFKDPLDDYPELSAPTHKPIVLKAVSMNLRDGTKLVQDIMKPEGEGRFPVILTRTPYGRANSLIGADKYAKRGYVFVSQDTRGRGDSGGVFDPFNTEIADGKDTLDWIVKQPWCDGNIGMIGASYGGMVQWSAAVTHHPALKCIIPQVSPPEPMKNIPWDNGAFFLGPAIWWARIVKDKNADLTQVTATISAAKGMDALPLTKVDDKVLKKNIPFFDNWVTRDTAAKWKGAYTTQMVSTVKIPTFHISGTWDGDGVGTMIHWDALRKSGGNQWLIFGPWSHAFNTASKLGDVDYGKGAILELDSEYMRFFDTYLKGKSAKWNEKPRVRFFVSGANRWYSGADWPAPESKPTILFFGEDRMLVAAPGAAKPDSYGYNPNKKYKDNPTQSGEGTTKMSPADLKDGLVYRTAPFPRPTTYAGPLTADLYFSTSGKDATFHVMVMDIDPKGVTRLIAMLGTNRATYVSGSFQPLTPNKIMKIEVKPWLFAHRFAEGHRMGIWVTSDTYPAFARNPGTGVPDRKATKLVAVTHKIYRDTAHPSCVRFWELPGF